MEQRGMQRARRRAGAQGMREGARIGMGWGGGFRPLTSARCTPHTPPRRPGPATTSAVGCVALRTHVGRRRKEEKGEGKRTCAIGRRNNAGVAANGRKCVHNSRQHHVAGHSLAAPFCNQISACCITPCRAMPCQQHAPHSTSGLAKNSQFFLPPCTQAAMHSVTVLLVACLAVAALAGNGRTTPPIHSAISHLAAPQSTSPRV